MHKPVSFRRQRKTRCRLSVCSFIVMEGGAEAFSHAQRDASTNTDEFEQ